MEKVFKENQMTLQNKQKHLLRRDVLFNIFDVFKP